MNLYNLFIIKYVVISIKIIRNFIFSSYAIIFYFLENIVLFVICYYIKLIYKFTVIKYAYYINLKDIFVQF